MRRGVVGVTGETTRRLHEPFNVASRRNVTDKGDEPYEKDVYSRTEGGENSRNNFTEKE